MLAAVGNWPTKGQLYLIIGELKKLLTKGMQGGLLINRTRQHIELVSVGQTV